MWTDLAPSVKETPALTFAKCAVLAGSTATELKLRQVEPAGKESEEFMAPLKRCYNCNDETVDPLAQRDIGLLQHQNTAAVLAFLRARFMKNVIYTTADPLLVAVNPFRDVGVCKDSDIVRYRDVPNVHSLPPHTFTIARQASDNLQGISKSQTIIVTGESGAGKTEATKHCMRFFASAKAGLDLRIQNAVMAANPVLEAFGNAKTLRNNNSSRFGRFMQLVLAKGGGIVNGTVKGFLLEKVRVIQQSPQERSYHIFYQFLKGATPEERKLYRLRDVSEYRNLNEKSGGCYDAPGIDDLEEWKDVRASFLSMGMSPEHVHAILSIVSGVMLLGNVKFAGKNIAGQDNAAYLEPGDQDILKEACELFFLPETDKVSEALRSTVKTIGKDEVTVRLQVHEASQLCYSLSKAMYNNLFQWIIKKLNVTIEPEKFGAFMGMLDIFGFEIFKENSLEQLLINITNEFLQKNFVDIVFEKENKLYRDEGVSAADLVFTDNKAVINALIGRSGSVFSALSDACVAKGGTDQGFYSSMTSSLASSTSFKKPAGGDRDLRFTICHTIADIDYMGSGFVEKNMDILKADLTEMAQASPSEVVRELFEGVKVERGKLAKDQLIASQFMIQLDIMMGIIMQTEPHFIRCVKPNETKKPLDWDNEKVVNQLFSLSILEALQLKKLGFSWRRSFKDFVTQFRYLNLHLDHEMSMANGDATKEKEVAMQFIQHLAKCHGAENFGEKKQWQMGKTMVFLKPEIAQATMLLLRQAMEDYAPCVNFIDALFKKRIARKALQARVGSLARLQARMRQRLVVGGTIPQTSIQPIFA